MGRKLICQYCGSKSTRDKMQQVKVGVTTKVNKYYHKEDCYQAYLDEEEFKKEEAIKRESLYETIMSIYDTKVLPNTFYMQIEGLRHGNRVFKRQNMGKRYRQGYDYDLIEETYLYSKDAIEWSLDNKAFTNLANALNYGISIIINNIYNVERRREAIQSREEMEMIAENVRKEDDLPANVFETSYKKAKEDEDDISFLFDD